MYILGMCRPNIGVHKIRIVEVFEFKDPFWSYLTILQQIKYLLEEPKQESLQLEEYNPAANDGPEKFIQHIISMPLLKVITRDSLIIKFGL